MSNKGRLYINLEATRSVVFESLMGILAMKLPKVLNAKEHRLTTVSYTHLDVYKRQVVECVSLELLNHSPHQKVKKGNIGNYMCILNGNMNLRKRK